jgi:DNA repair exonuclease SbcCD ATPase subunit
LQVTLQEGKALAGDAEEMLGNAAQLSRRLNERNEVLRTALAELNGVMTSAQTGLSAMSNMGSAHWGAAMMDDARKPMIAAVELVAMQEQPVQRPAPEAAQAMLDKAEQLAQAARMYADAHLSEIASRLGEVTDKRRALAQAIAVAEDAAQGDAQVLDEFRALQMRVQELELRSAHATSFAEALDALTQAVQHAQRFAGRVVGV